MEVKFELLDDLLIRFPFYANVCNLEQDGDCYPGHGGLEERCLVEKKEGTAGSVLGGGSFLRREGVPGTKKEAPV